jgi:hypothetical protein
MAPSSTWCTFHCCSDCHVATADHCRNGKTVDSIRMKRVRIVDGQNATLVRIRIQIDCMTSLARTKGPLCPESHSNWRHCSGTRSNGPLRVQMPALLMHHPRRRPFEIWTDRMATFTRIKRLLCPKTWRAKLVQSSRRWAENSGFYPHKCYPGRLATQCQRLLRCPRAPP